MKIKTRNRERVILSLLVMYFMLSGSFPEIIRAANWPEKDITVIVTYPPGGGYDVVARLTAPFIAKYLPQKVGVVVKNVPGGGTRIGTRELVKAKPDGYTICIANPTSVGLMQEIGDVEWLDIRKLSWLAQLDNLPDIVLAGPKTGFKKLTDMKGKTVKFVALDDGGNFETIIWARSLGIKPVLVYYKGTGEGVMSLLRGDVDAIVLSWSSGMRQVTTSENKLIPLAVSSKVRGLNVPSGKEMGVEVDEAVMYHPHTMAAPPGLSPEIRRMWEGTFIKVLNDPEWISQMEKLGYPPSPLVGKEKLEASINEVMDKMKTYKDVISTLSKIK